MMDNDRCSLGPLQKGSFAFVKLDVTRCLALLLYAGVHLGYRNGFEALGKCRNVCGCDFFVCFQAPLVVVGHFDKGSSLFFCRFHT